MITTTTELMVINNATPTLETTFTDAELATQFRIEEMLQRSGYVHMNKFNSEWADEWVLPQSNQIGNTTVNANTLAEITKTVDQTTGETTLKAEPLKASEELGLKKGGNVAKVGAMSVIMPALSGCGIGWELYKEYPQFWTDLSDSLFSHNMLSDNATDSTAMDVIFRAVEDGGVKAYCEKRAITNVIENALDLGAFAPNGAVVPKYRDVGIYENPTHGGATTSMLHDVVAPYCTLTSEQVQTLDYQAQLGNINNANAMTVRMQKATHGSTQNDIIFVFWNVDDTHNQVKLDRISGAYFIDNNYNNSIEGVGGVRVSYDNRTGLANVITYISTIGGTDKLYYGSYNDNTYTSNIIYSTLASTYTPPVQGLKYSDDTIMPTSKADIWEKLADWLTGSFTTTTVDPTTGEVVENTYLPIGLFDTDTVQSVDPSVDAQTSAQSGILPQTDPLQLPSWVWDWFNPSIVSPNNGTPSENSTGDTPVVVPPTNNNSSKLFTVYNPNWSQLNNLGAYLWSNEISTLIKELFSNNRMDAIISLHQVYCTPSTSGNAHIILGNLDSNVSAPVVNNQYVSIDCGTQYVAEVYGDARDYLNVDCQIYLPFIGFRNVDPHDVINCYVNIKYTIDVYTGSCLAQIIVTKGSYTQTLYTFEGNCSIQIPLTGSDRARVIGAIASTVATGISTGGVGALAMGVGQVTSGGVQSNIQRTSGFSGNCGAMAIKKPYIVLTRMKSCDAIDYNKIVGNPTNKTVYLCNCSGFTRIKEIHLDNIKATDREKQMLYDALKQGIVI